MDKIIVTESRPSRRFCLVCRTNIAHRGVRSIRCIECQNIHNVAYQRQYRHEHRQFNKEYARRYRQENTQSLEQRERTRQHKRAYNQQPEVKAKTRDRMRRLRRKPDYGERYKLRTHLYNQRPEIKERNAAAQRHRRAQKGAELRKHLWFLYQRQGGQCGICSKALAPDPMKATVDHIIPISFGGTNDLENLQASHGPCNFAKRNRVKEQNLWLI